MLFENLGRGTILFTPKVMKIFSMFRQFSPNSTEAGGYLIGQEFGDQIVVQIATLPGQGDIRRLTLFKRNRKRGQRLINQIWKASGGTMILVGEWHTHNEKKPVPSLLDIQETSKSFMKNEFNSDFLVVVIVSSESIVNSWVGVQTQSCLSRLKRVGYQLWSDEKNECKSKCQIKGQVFL